MRIAYAVTMKKPLGTSSRRTREGLAEYISLMTSGDGRAEWTARWQVATPRLAAIRTTELRRLDVAAFIACMSDAFEAAQAAASVSTTSGLVVQQRLFAKWRA